MVRRTAFTLVEVMIAIGIVGVLASLAIPSFSAYLHKAKFAEAYTHLGSMSTGVKAYYGTEQYTQGVTAAGSSAEAATGCTVDSGMTTNTPSSKKTVLDWSTESSSFASINFAPSDPVLFHYAVGTVGAPATSTYAWSNGCGITIAGWAMRGCCGHDANNLSAQYQVEAKGNPNDGPDMYSIYFGFCTNADNELYVCSQVAKPSDNSCTVSSPGAPGQHNSFGALQVAGVGLLLLRRRRASRV